MNNVIEYKHKYLDKIMSIDCLPVLDEKTINNCDSISLSKIASCGLNIGNYASLFKTTSDATTGRKLYRMIIPRNGKKGKLQYNKDGSTYGHFVDKNSVIQKRGRYVEVKPSTLSGINPYLLMINVAMTSINNKLDELKSLQEEIFEYLKLKDESEVRGHIKTLQEILIEYQYNINNDKYKNNKHILVQSIKNNSEQKIQFILKQINNKKNKMNLIHTDGSVKKKLENLDELFCNYDLCLYLYSFASFIEVMLLENFESGYLSTVHNNMLEHVNQYKSLYQNTYEKLLGDSKSSIQSIAALGLSNLEKGLGTKMAKLSYLSDKKITTNLISRGEKHIESTGNKAVEKISSFSNKDCLYAMSFIDNINKVNKLFNEDVELLFDENNLYIE